MHKHNASPLPARSLWRHFPLWLQDWGHTYFRFAVVDLTAVANSSATLTPQEVQYWCRQIDRHPHCTAVLTLCSHRSGYLRASAVTRLGQQAAGAHIAAIVARFNDWVPEVRLAAQVAMRSHLRAAFYREWLQCWPQIRALYQCRRAEHRLLVMEIEQFLLKGKQRHLLCAALHAPQRALAREACRLVAHAELLPKASLIAYALQSRDRQIAGCAPAWIASLPRSEQPTWLERGREAPLRQVRAACARMLARL